MEKNCNINCDGDIFACDREAIDDRKNLMWQELSKKTVYDAGVLRVSQIESRSPAGTVGKYTVLDANDWVIVIPVVGENFLMVEQWRHGAKTLSMEFPGGVIDAGESPEQGARRELLEETGCVAQKLTKLGSLSPNPAIMSNKVHVFLAEDLVQKCEQNLDADEYVKCHEIAQRQVLKRMGSKEYPHALMACSVALYLAQKD